MVIVLPTIAKADTIVRIAIQIRSHGAKYKRSKRIKSENNCYSKVKRAKTIGE